MNTILISGDVITLYDCPDAIRVRNGNARTSPASITINHVIDDPVPDCVGAASGYDNAVLVGISGLVDVVTCD